MSIEDDIKQREFRNEYHKALLNIIYTGNHIISELSQVFKKYNITLQQYNVLRILKGQYPGSASVNVIKERMLDRMSDTSRLVERLRVKGLVDRQENPKDKRAVEITITETGLNLLENMADEVNETEKVLCQLEADEATNLSELLDKVRARSKK